MTSNSPSPESDPAQQAAPSLAVIILAAGASARMGRPKMLLPWAGTTVIGHLLSQWRRLGAAQIVVVLRPDLPALAQELDRLQFPEANRILNPQPERGMFSSIRCAARWPGWRGGLTHWAIALGDQPHLREATLRRLLAAAAAQAGAVCQPTFNGHGAHPVVLPQPAFAALKDSPAETLKEFLKLVAVSSVQCPMDDPSLALDLDTPEDYISAKSLFAA